MRLTYSPYDNVSLKLDWNLGALADGLRCYQREEFFLAHEHWESVWLKSREPEKSFLQALIQIAAAFHHLQRKNLRGAASLLRAALRKLERYPGHFESVEVAPLREGIEAWLEAIEGQDGSGSFPPMPFPRVTETTGGRA
jgi:predicted metal-dependent hydrolase